MFLVIISITVVLFHSVLETQSGLINFDFSVGCNKNPVWNKSGSSWILDAGYFHIR